MGYESGTSVVTVPNLETLTQLVAKRLRCVGHPESIGDAVRPEFSGRYLGQLVSDPQEFMTNTWDRAVARAEGVVPTGLFSSKDADGLLSYGGLRTPEIRLVKDRAGVPNEAYMSDRALGYSRVTGVIDHHRVRALVADGATMLFQGIRRFWEPIDTFAAGLEGDLGAPVQATVFFTPANGSGIPKHHDLHSVFVMQLEGARRWTYGMTGGRRPNAHVDPNSIADDSLMGETVLQQGDCLYIPRGTPHLAHVVPGQSSLHLTLSLRDAPTVSDVAGALVAALIEDDVTNDQAIPCPWDATDERLREELGACLARTAAQLSALPMADVTAMIRNAVKLTLSKGEPTGTAQER
jgi:hypothetical protein